MSVIWSGVTEEGAVVPVQVTAEGKVVAVGDGPEGDYLKLTGGNLTGDLTLGVDRITLNAADGSATFAGNVLSTGTANTDFRFQSKTFDTETFSVVGNGTLKIGENKVVLNSDGSATFAGNVQAEGSATFAGNVEAKNGPVKVLLNAAVGQMYINTSTSVAIQVQSLNDPGVNKILLGGDGSGTFTGDVVIGSRGEQWLIRESNGVAMLVQQSLLKQPREIEKLRDLPNELDLIEAALSEIMDKLRMTPPAGWPVWDGESEVTSDNDNA